jgi:hypothetical protein
MDLLIIDGLEEADGCLGTEERLGRERFYRGEWCGEPDAGSRTINLASTSVVKAI